MHSTSSKDYIVSSLNNYLEAHQYIVGCSNEKLNVVAEYGFGYTDESNEIFRWVEGGDIEECSLSKEELNHLIEEGLSDKSFKYILDCCE
jgi:hypothetical protein